MENLTKVKTCAFKQDYISNGETKKIYTVETEDGKTGQAWADIPAGTEVTWTEKMYKDKPQYTFFVPKEKKAGSSFPPKDYKFIKRDSALRYAIELVKTQNLPLKSADVLKVAEVFYEFLNKQ